jgi:hypothetical protein
MMDVTIEHPDGVVTVDSDQLRRLADNIRSFRMPGEEDEGAVESLVPDPADMATEFVEAPELEAMGQRLLAEHQRFELHRKVNPAIAYLWKRSGGEKGGVATLGKTQRPSGLLAYFAGVDFVIWAAADHCFKRRFGAEQLEALVFHKLCHVGVDRNYATYVMSHDFEGFRDEVESYGFWKPDIAAISKAFQLRLQMEAS